MSDKPLKIKQLVMRFVLEEVIEGKNTVSYVTEKEGEKNPQYVSFSVARGVENSENYTGQSVISGSVFNGSFQLSTPITDIEDYQLLKHIHCTANDILTNGINPDNLTL